MWEYRKNKSSWKLIVDLESNRIINHDRINFTRFSSRGTKSTRRQSQSLTLRLTLSYWSRQSSYNFRKSFRAVLDCFLTDQSLSRQYNFTFLRGEIVIRVHPLLAACHEALVCDKISKRDRRIKQNGIYDVSI